jgi:hypothetical protein
MRLLTSLSTALLLGAWLCTLYAAPVAAQERVRAKVGIQLHSGEHTAAAKSTENVKQGDALRIYIVPENDAYIYIVHNDGSAITLLNAQNASTKIAKGTQIVLPSPEKFYQIDGTSSQEAITVLCSPTELRDVMKLASAPKASPQHWLTLEQTLTDKSKIQLGQQADKPFQIAGNVRSIGTETFADTLPISSGNTLVVKKYVFQVQK